MKVLLLLPYSIDSHLVWAREIQDRSRHEVEIMGLSGSHWKWRMHGGAVSLARQFMELKRLPDLIVATDMLDLSTFLSLVRKRASQIPSLLYFHENQLTYPWSQGDADVKKGRDRHYGWINYVSALAADRVVFNSDYQKKGFIEALHDFLQAFPDHQQPENVKAIAHKSGHLPLGLDSQQIERYRTHTNNSKPVVLWNHRWEYDKNPEDFFLALSNLSDKGIDFDLLVLGRSFGSMPAAFENAKSKLKDHIIHWGFAADRSTYYQWLWKADVLPVTSVHDYFGMSVLEAIRAKTYPLLPRRLAYPEHISPETYPNHYYSSQAELEQKLESYLLAPKPFPQPLQHQISRYDWEKVIGQYDELFESLAGA